MIHPVLRRPARPRFSFRQSAAAGAATLLLASCASYSGIESTAHVRAPADYASAASLPAQGGQWPDMFWARKIGGAPLQALIDEALSQNPGMQTAAARVASAQALAEAAGAAARPTVAGVFSSTYQRYSENGIIPPPLGGTYQSDNLLSLNLSYDFDFWGRHAAELRAALSQGKVAEAEQHAARMMLATSIARTWVQLARQYDQMDLVAEQIAVRQKSDRLTTLRVSAGLDTRVENELSRQQVAGLRTEQAQWQEAVALTRNQLAALMGQGPDRGQRIARPVLVHEAASAQSAGLPDELPLELLGRRPDIVAARWRVEAALGDIDVAKAQFYPNVNLAAFAGFSSLGLSNLLQSGSRVVGIGPAIRVPLFETGSLRAQLKGRVAAYDAAVAAYNQTLTDALREVADQVQSLKAVQAQSEHQRAAMQAATNSLRLAQQRERVGTTNMLPALATQLNWLSQRKITLDLETRRAELQIGLIKALGGGFDAASQGLAPAPTSAPTSAPESGGAAAFSNRFTSTESAS
jgi:NodT family efflux transporter outer membrane factor (OMF) lipoprotein